MLGGVLGAWAEVCGLGCAGEGKLQGCRGRAGSECPNCVGMQHWDAG